MRSKVAELHRQKRRRPKERRERDSGDAAEDSAQTIGIDCAPGELRPGDLIGGVIEGTGLPKRRSAKRMFGAWTWEYSDIPRDVWLKARRTVKKRLAVLYLKGMIRGAKF